MEIDRQALEIIVLIGLPACLTIFALGHLIWRKYIKSS